MIVIYRATDSHKTTWNDELIILVTILFIIQQKNADIYYIISFKNNAYHTYQINKL